MNKKLLPRRTVLRGLGVTMALPLLDCMLPWWSEKVVAQTLGNPRLVILYKPNGYYPGSWTVNSMSALPDILQPLNSLKTQVTFVQGMNNSSSASYSDGHAPRLSCFLTGGPITASTSTVSAPKSIDQIVAGARGTKALTLSGPYSYPTDNGFNGEYFSSLSWIGPRADTKLMKPRAVFDQIFASVGGPAIPSSETINKVYKKSILDYVSATATVKKASLGATDRAKMEEFLTGVRELEVRIGQIETAPVSCIQDMSRPGADQTFEAHTKLMLDLWSKLFSADEMTWRLT